MAKNSYCGKFIVYQMYVVLEFSMVTKGTSKNAIVCVYKNMLPQKAENIKHSIF